MKGSSMNAEEYEIQKAKEYQVKLDKRMAEMQVYWEQHPEPVKIILTEDSRNYLKVLASGKETGKEWNTLEQKVKDVHAEMVNDGLKKLRIIEPNAFIEPKKISRKVS